MMSKQLHKFLREKESRMKDFRTRRDAVIRRMNQRQHKLLKKYEPVIKKIRKKKMQQRMLRCALPISMQSNKQKNTSTSVTPFTKAIKNNISKDPNIAEADSADEGVAAQNIEEGENQDEMGQAVTDNDPIDNVNGEIDEADDTTVTAGDIMEDVGQNIEEDRSRLGNQMVREVEEGQEQGERQDSMTIFQRQKLKRYLFLF